MHHFPWCPLPGNRATRLIAWQGWKLELPRRWDPVKLEGDHANGFALFADTLRPRLGLRWQTPKRKSGFDSHSAVRLALRDEVGQLAATEATQFPVEEDGDCWQSPLLYTEPEPPGRDVFSVYSRTSHRLLQIAYHAHRRERILADSILPTLADLPVDRATLWSIFDLSCVIPGGMNLQSQQLNAGDLGLTFSDRFNRVNIRQIAVADLALKRQSLDAWITDQQKNSSRYFLRRGAFTDIEAVTHGETRPARLSRMHRRSRYFWMWNLHRNLATIGVHDPDRNRLILLHGSDESLMQQIATTVGCAQ